MDERTIRVMIVDDHDVVRRGLSVFLKTFNGVELVAEAANGAEAVQCCQETKPDVVLMDLQMPEMDGVEATRAIRAAHPETQIIILTSYKDDDLVRSALQAGAVGYLLKNASIDDMVNAIRSAMAGKVTLSPEVTQSLLKNMNKPMAPVFNLTERELEVLALMVQGLNNATIAEKLVVGRSTVKFHVSSILAKMNVSSRTEAVALAVQHHLVN